MPPAGPARRVNASWAQFRTVTNIRAPRNTTPQLLLPLPQSRLAAPAPGAAATDPAVGPPQARQSCTRRNPGRALIKGGAYGRRVRTRGLRWRRRAAIVCRGEQKNWRAGAQESENTVLDQDKTQSNLTWTGHTGWAMSYNNTMTSNGTEMRSPVYLGPEQAAGRPAAAKAVDTVLQEGFGAGQGVVQGTVNSQTLESLRQHTRNASTFSSTSAGLGRTRASLQRQRAGQTDPRSPLVTLMPVNANPTEVLAGRFASWRAVIKAIIVYLTETASIQDELVRQHLRLSHAVSFPFFSVENVRQPSTPEEKAIQQFFLPLGSGSIQDLPTILTGYHAQMASMASKASKELTNEVIPRLEDMRRDLLVKIKEIKSLQSDFKNSCAKEVSETKQMLRTFHESVEQARYGTPKSDPYLTRILLDKQLKRQLAEENFLHQAFNNLQASGKELEKVVVMEIQSALTVYARILGREAQLVFDSVITKLDMGFLSRDPVFEWDDFIARDPNFVEPSVPMRSLKDITYKHQYDPLTYKLQCGFLERRSKFLKSYSRGFYVLTPSFLHEFKTCDRKKDVSPVMSLSLSDCTVAEHSKRDSSDFKFILHAKQNGIIHRGHNWVFRVDSYDTMMEWFNNIKKLTSISNPTEKAKWITEHLNLDVNGRPKRHSLLRDNQSTTTTRTSSNLDSPNNAVQYMPNYDGHTNTNTTLSSPGTSYILESPGGATIQIPLSNKKEANNSLLPPKPVS
ncbi:ADL234Cp [Eremothecium gossypii ATCC 10895]|uniref:ADL234Cp n=1 Tax=Eremothecium gossypii (strain ATCC 10895 / CBS 109.51 / FGSC 9923 / NRRL Y-1056) TaxID=284811 RepID=Q75B11_EREGS|nr:ADL234Cp [Eremothecium gossypii ATCC 10895]AAS51686.1 ADL234Cp [Eremothecium gossypii ATCC 10895]